MVNFRTQRVTSQRETIATPRVVASRLGPGSIPGHGVPTPVEAYGHMCARANTHTHTETHAHTYTHTHTHIHTDRHTYTHNIHTYTHT